ncbi:hypothetical protein HKX48_000820 [Thoreauomyces humboldtii]|nr:hypothetical protein HKX48_000820 [Thoreauomyces humboldtii]
MARDKLATTSPQHLSLLNSVIQRSMPFLPASVTRTLVSHPRLLLLPFILSNFLVLRFLTRWLLPFVASQLVARSRIEITGGAILNPTADGVDMTMKGRVSEAGPIEAVIRFDGVVKLGYLGAEGDVVVVGEAVGMPPIHAVKGCAQLDAKVHVRITDHKAFGTFAETMMQSKIFELVLLADDITVLVMGVVPIRHVSMRKTLALKGLDALSDISIKEAVATSGTKDHILLSTTCEMQNPSDLSISMGDVVLGLYHEGVHRVGYVEMRDLVLAPGLNVVTCVAKYSPQTTEQARSGRLLLGQYVTGQPSTVTIRGSLTTSTPFAYFGPALASLDVTTILPGETRKMITRTQLVIDPFRLATLQSATRLEIFNPMEAPVSILWMKGRVTCRGEVIGTLDEDLVARNQVVVVPAGQFVMTGTMGMRLQISKSAVTAIMAAGFSGGKTRSGAAGLTLFDVDVESTLGCMVGQYSVDLDYRQEGVPVGLF